MQEIRFSFFSLIASSIVLLLGDVIQISNRDNVAWTVCLAISFLLFVGGIPAINLLLANSTKSLRLIINVFLLIGAMAGASMQVLFRSTIILENEKFSDAAQVLSNNPLLAFTTMVPGIFFPIGLILVSMALFILKKFPSWKIALLLAGAISFPVGHAIGNPIALVGGDLLLISAWLVLSKENFRG